MKKTVSLFIVLAMLLLCACGSNTQATDPTSTTQTTTGTEDSANSSENDTHASEPTEGSANVPSEDSDTAPTDAPNATPDTTPTDPNTTPTGPIEAPSTPTACSHSWTAATCTTAKTCSKCNAVEGSALGHSYKDATCTAAKTCTRCNATTGTALGHKWTAANCTTPKTCSACKITEGSAAGHKWSDATCQTPKKCSACKITEGNVVKHVVSGDTCKWCKQVVPVDPSGFNANLAYSCISQRYDGDEFAMPGATNCYVITFLHLGSYSSSQAVRLIGGSYSGCPDGYLPPFHHNGNYYDSIAQWDGLNGDVTYEIVGSEIVATVVCSLYYPEITTTNIHFELLSNGTLRVTSISGNPIVDIAGIHVGTIFYPNANPYPNSETN